MSNKKKLEQQKQRRAKNVQAWLDMGIDRSIISRYDLRNKNPDKVRPAVFTEIKKESKSAKIKATKKRKAQERHNFLTSQGFKKSEIKKSWLQSDKRMYEALGLTDPLQKYTPELYLGVCFTTRKGVVYFNGTEEYKNDTFEEILDQIYDRVEEAVSNPDGSDKLRLIFKIVYGDKFTVDYMLSAYEKRGYNLKIGKLIDRRYYRLFNRNDWTMREYAEMLLCIIDQCHNEVVPDIIKDLRKYVEKAGLPFLQIFNKYQHLIDDNN